MKRIAIDMDEVIVDTAPVHLAAYNQLFSSDLRLADLRGRSIYEAISSDQEAATRDILHEHDFFQNLPEMFGAVDTVRSLSESYEIFIATAAMEFPNSFPAKFRWLQSHLPFIPPSHIVFCGDKSIIQADFLIDDSPRHFTHFCGQGILYTAPHNYGATGYPRVDSWDEVRQRFL